jgi:hypothetical protein
MGSFDESAVIDALSGSDEEEEQTEITVTVKITDDDGVPVGGVKMIFPELELTTDATDSDGCVSVTLPVGKQSVVFDTELCDGYYLIAESSIEIVDDKTVYEIGAINTTPNGTESRPYLVNHEKSNFTVPVGVSYNFIVYRAVKLILAVEGEGYKLTYNGEEYQAQDGKLSVALLGEDVNSVASLVIENVSGESIEISLFVDSEKGTQGNPIEIETLDGNITAMIDDIVYYTYTASEDGTITVTVLSEDTYVSVQNTTDSKTASSDGIAGATVSVEVKAGDRIIIDVSCGTESDEQKEVGFSISMS